MNTMMNKMFLPMVMALILPIILMAGCSTMAEFADQWQSLSALEKAQKTDEMFLKSLDQYKDDIQAKYEVFLSVGNQEGMDLIQEEIAPVVNKAEFAVNEYHQAVAQWQKLGEMPDDMEQKTQMAKDVMNKLETLMIKHALENTEE